MRWIYWLGWRTLGAIFHTLFGLRVEGREHLVEHGAVLVASNHQSYLDPPLIGNLYKTEMHYLARKTLFRGPANWLYRQWNSIPVDQDRPDMASLKAIIRLLKEGQRVLVFPEGSRTLDGKLDVAQPGVGLIAAKAGAAIQPVRIRGAREALPRGSGRIHFARICVTIGPAIHLTAEEIKSAQGKDGYQKLADRIMAAIAEL